MSDKFKLTVSEEDLKHTLVMGCTRESGLGMSALSSKLTNAGNEVQAIAPAGAWTCRPMPSPKQLTKLQKLLIAYIDGQGGKHVFIGRTTAPSPESKLGGYTWEGVHLSLRSLVSRGLLTVQKECFYYTANSQK